MDKRKKHKSTKVRSSKKEITVFSEAFPPNKDGSRDLLYSSSETHVLMKDKPINIEKIVYKPIPLSFYDEVKNLHKEWFPINYDNDYFERVFENKNGWYFNVGAFYELEEEKKEILLGMALCEWVAVDEYFVKHTSRNTIEKICKNINYKEEVKKFLTFNNYHCVYIMTIGVVDEYRKLHIGSQILAYIQNIALSDDLCTCVYLDVVIYNKSGISFYEKNQFENVTTIKNYYHIKGQHYDSNVFVKIFTRQEKDYYKFITKGFVYKFFDFTLFTPLSLILKIVIFFLFFQCFRQKIKYD